MWYSKDFVLRKILEKCPDRRDEVLKKTQVVNKKYNCIVNVSCRYYCDHGHMLYDDDTLGVWWFVYVMCNTI